MDKLYNINDIDNLKRSKQWHSYVMYLDSVKEKIYKDMLAETGNAESYAAMLRVIEDIIAFARSKPIDKSTM